MSEWVAYGIPAVVGIALPLFYRWGLRVGRRQGWDEAAASIVDEHGNPIKPTNIDNPYRSQA